MWCHSISSAFKLDFLVHISSFSSIAIVGLKHDDFLSCYVTGATVRIVEVHFLKKFLADLNCIYICKMNKKVLKVAFLMLRSTLLQLKGSEVTPD